MVNQRERREMSEYIAANLEGTGENIVRKTKELVPGIKSNYIIVGTNGAVILVDRAYSGDSLKQLGGVFKHPRNNITNLAYVLFKDGETFFRSAVAGEDKTGVKSKRFRADEEHSLKHYSDRMDKVISMRPEELYISRGLGRTVQYYQPKSERLEQGIVSYKFEPVELDYSHIPSDARFGPVTRDSERLSIWTKTGLNPGKFKLENSLLVPRA